MLAVVVLILNDHLFKAAYPGFVTGKLSDAAGMVLAPPLLAALTGLLAPNLNPRRVALIALLTVGAGFTITKSCSYGADLASTAWSVVYPSDFRADRTDLLTLPFLAVAGWTWTAARRRPAPTRWVRAARVGLLLPLALIGVAATSPAEEPSAFQAATTTDGIYLVSDDPHYELDFAVSKDDGVSWTPVDKYGSSITAAPSPGGRYGEDLLERLPQPATQACSKAAPRTCYRIVAGALGVQRSTDGGATWADDWGISAAERQGLARAFSGKVNPDRDLVSRAITVHDVLGHGQVVIVANGRDGFAQRDLDGTWRRIGFPSGRGPGPADLPALGAVDPQLRYLNISTAVAATILLAGLIVVAGAAWAAAHAGRPSWWIAPAGLAIGGPLLLLAALAGDTNGRFFPFLLVGAPIVIIGTPILAVLATLAVRRASVAWRGWAAQVWAGGLLTGALATAIWAGWLAGAVPGRGTAVLWSLAACLPGLVIAALAARSIRPGAPRLPTTGFY